MNYMTKYMWVSSAQKKRVTQTPMAQHIPILNEDTDIHELQKLNFKNLDI